MVIGLRLCHLLYLVVLFFIVVVLSFLIRSLVRSHLRFLIYSFFSVLDRSGFALG